MTQHIQRQFMRVFLSVEDMKKCRMYLVAAKKALEENQLDAMGGLMAAAIVAYARPFSANENHETAVAQPPFSERQLTEAQAIIHKKILTLRNKVIAHSDAEMSPAKIFSSNPDGFQIISAVYDPRREWDKIDSYMSVALVVEKSLEKTLFNLYDKLGIGRA